MGMTLKAIYLSNASDYQKIARGWHNSAAHSMEIGLRGEPAYLAEAARCQHDAANASARAMKFLFLAMECGK